MVLPEYGHTGQPSPEVARMHTSPVSQSQLPAPEGTMRPQFYQMSSAPPPSTLSVQFMDSNPRPTKSPRHAVAPDLSSLPLYASFEERVAPSYTIPPQASDQGLPLRDYYPVTLPPENWTTGENGNVTYSTSMPAPTQHYTYPPEPYPKDNSQQTHYTWSAA